MASIFDEYNLSNTEICTEIVYSFGFIRYTPSSFIKTVILSRNGASHYATEWILINHTENNFTISMLNDESWTQFPINKSMSYPKNIISIKDLIMEISSIYKLIEDSGFTILNKEYYE